MANRIDVLSRPLGPVGRRPMTRNRVALCRLSSIRSRNTGTPYTFDGSANEGLNPEALTFAWAFGDGGTSNVQDPTYTYNAAGNYTISLTAGNGFFTDTVTAPIAIVNPPTAVSLATLDAANGNGGVVLAMVAGLALLAGAVVVLRRRC